MITNESRHDHYPHVGDEDTGNGKAAGAQDGGVGAGG